MRRSVCAVALVLTFVACGAFKSVPQWIGATRGS